ncbi:hypothetical protein MRX96_017897 [Rhipicephalus microplus]
MKCKTQGDHQGGGRHPDGRPETRKGAHSFDRRCSVIHCTGYLKSWAIAAPVLVSLLVLVSSRHSNHHEYIMFLFLLCNLSCSVTVGRVHGYLASSPATGTELYALDLKRWLSWTVRMVSCGRLTVGSGQAMDVVLHSAVSSDYGRGVMT